MVGDDAGALSAAPSSVEWRGRLRASMVMVPLRKELW